MDRGWGGHISTATVLQNSAGNTVFARVYCALFVRKMNTRKRGRNKQFTDVVEPHRENFLATFVAFHGISLIFFRLLNSVAAEAQSFSKFEEKKKQHSDKRKQTVRSIFKKSGQSSNTFLDADLWGGAGERFEK